MGSGITDNKIESVEVRNVCRILLSLHFTHGRKYRTSLHNNIRSRVINNDKFSLSMTFQVSAKVNNRPDDVLQLHNKLNLR